MSAPVSARLRALNLPWLVPDWPAPPRVQALMTTRAGRNGAAFDVSTRAPGNTLAETGRAQLEALCGRPIVWLDQVHGTRVLDPLAAPSDEPADALVLDGPALAGAIQTADCLPVLFCDRAGHHVAAAHAGWRGLAAGVLEATVARLPVPRKEIMAWLGAAIGPAAFEVGEEVRAAFCSGDSAATAFFSPSPPGKWRADLDGLARLRLARIGVSAVYGGGLCTWSDAARFYSHRRGKETGRMAALIWLEDSPLGS